MHVMQRNYGQVLINFVVFFVDELSVNRSGIGMSTTTNHKFYKVLR